MKTINSYLYKIILSIIFMMLTVSAQAKPGIEITAPQDGAIVIPGEEITVTAEAVDGFELKQGMVGVTLAEVTARNIFSLPATLIFKIRQDAVGEGIITVIGISKTKEKAADEIKFKVKQIATLQSIQINQDYISVDLDWDGNIKEKKSGYIVSAYGIYSDGVRRNIDNDPNTTYTSSDPSVISVDNKGKFQVHKVGTAAITVSNSGISKVIPVVFRQPIGLRPLETIPPTIQIDIQPAPNQAGWHNQDIIITLTAQDNEGGSGISEISYQFPYLSAKSTWVEDNQAIIPFNREGIYLFRYVARDKERNSTGQQSLELRLDKTPPQFSLTSPKQGMEYFYDQSIPLTYTATDALSGINTTLISLDNTDITGQANIQPRVGSHTLVLTATDKADNKAATQANFIVKLKADITIKPEVFISNKGIFLAIVKFPSGYDHKTITDAVCDGAQAQKIIKTKKSAIIVFRKEDITETTIDTTFTVTGHFANNLIFEGTDTIKKVIQRKGLLGGRKDKEDEETEINKAIDELLGNDKRECKRIKKEIGEIK